jgi:hypothetical protein
MSLRAILPIGGAGFAPLTGAVALRTTSPIKRVHDMAKSPSKLASKPRREPAPPLYAIAHSEKPSLFSSMNLSIMVFT